MNTRKLFATLFLAALFGGLIAVGTVKVLEVPQDQQIQPTEQVDNIKFSSLLEDKDFTVPEGLNFVYAAEVSTPAVVHIRSSYQSQSGSGQSQMDQFFDLFGAPPRNGDVPMGASGSGVIISSDGYIVTNNHVIEKADDIEVILENNQSYSAKLIGTDPNTDLALIKISENNLPHLTYGDSDAMRIGEWVLAVGNPFDLTSTVTAGIVSAKARNINILRRNYGIESFIQTDAAVNPGNSGGALVNLKGELIGINTAIATRTGSYSGYSFAVPVSLVQKVVSDLKEFGIVQRAILGINIRNIDKQLAEAEDLDVVNGVYILGVGENSAADEAGIEIGDIIVAINDAEVKGTSELQELVARNRPGDKIKVTLIRNGKSKQVFATLKNMNQNYEVVERASLYNFEGAELNNLEEDLLSDLELEGGAQVNDISSGKWQDAGVEEGFIVTHVDKQPIRDADQLLGILRNKRGGTLIEGTYPDGNRAFYGIGF